MANYDEQVLEALPSSPAAIADKLGVGRSVVGRTLRELIDRGLVHGVNEYDPVTHRPLRVYRHGLAPDLARPKFADDPLLGAFFGRASE